MSAEWQFIVSLNEQLRPLRSAAELQEVALRLIGQHLGASRVNYSYVDGDEFVINRCYTDGVQPITGRGPLTLIGKGIVETYRRGETVIVKDVQVEQRLTEAERAHWVEMETAALVGVPLIKDGRWLATLNVHSAMPRQWTNDQIALVEVTAQRTWAMGERARVEEALSRGESRQAFLRRLSDMILPLSDPEIILNEACRLIGSHLRVNRAVYGEIDGDDCIMYDGYVDGVPPLPQRVPWRHLGDSRLPEILNGGTLTSNDTSLDGHAPGERASLQAAGIGAYICPLLVKDGRFVAAFGIHSRLPRVWTQDEIDLVTEVADRIWATLEHRRAEAELRANEDRLAFLLRLNDALRPLQEPSAVQETAARLLAEHLGVARAGYAEIDGQGYVVRSQYAHGVPPLPQRGPSLTFGAALHDAYLRGEMLVANNVASDARLTNDERRMMAERQMGAYITVRLIKAGRPAAAFGVSHPSPRTWTASEMGLVRDVAERTWEASERARVEATLREQEAQFHRALTAAGAGCWTWDPRSGQTVWDSTFRARFDMGPDEPPSIETFFARVHPDDRPGLQAQVPEILASRDRWENTYRFVFPDGTVRWMRSLGHADRDVNGEVTRLTGFELDITEQRQTEEARHARREEEYNRDLKLLLETSTQGVVSIDAQGVIVTANRAFDAMFGWEPGELIGHTIERLLPLPSREAHAEHRGSYFTDPRPRRMGGGGYFMGLRKDGSTFPIEVSLNHVQTSAGGRAFAFITDVTERHRAAAALRQRTAELEDRTKQLSQMAWDLTLAEHHAREHIARTLHDGLQQLLVIVALNLDLQLKREAEAGHASDTLLIDAKRHLDDAIAAARSLSRELFPPVLHRSGLPAALGWLANWTYEKYKLEVEVDADPRADSTRSDLRTLLYESTRELLFNAVKHAKTTHVRLSLTLDADDQLCMTVADDGVGFDPASLDDRWKTGQGGWGLFSIRERLTLLGGRLDVDSAIGRGTRVRLVAPRGTSQGSGSEPASPREPRLARSAVDEKSAHDPLRVLLVDDHAAVRDMLRKTLHERPHLRVVGEAADGIDAIAQARRLRPDVILMDIFMPHMDGIEATERIRAELPEIQIFGLSMQARSETVHAIELAGAAAYFVKGLDTQRLLDRLLTLHTARVGSML